MFIVSCSYNLILYQHPGIYLRMNIPVTNGKQISLTVNTLCAEYFNELLEKVKLKEKTSEMR